MWITKVKYIIVNINNIITSIETDVIFVAIGQKPNTSFLENDLVDLDNNGYIITKNNMSTSVNGIWAAGYVQDPKYKKITISVGSGCIAAIEVEQWLKNNHLSRIE